MRLCLFVYTDYGCKPENKRTICRLMNAFDRIKQQLLMFGNKEGLCEWLQTTIGNRTENLKIVDVPNRPFSYSEKESQSNDTL